MAADSEGNSEWQVKAFVQNAAEFHSHDLKSSETRLIFWSGAIATIALASAGLWIGVIGVAALVIGRGYWLIWYVERWISRVNRFRNRFRELLKREDQMRPEDQEFLRKHTDSILFPLAVATQSREAVTRRDLEHVEVLYLESYFGNSHPRSGPHEGCKLCMAAQPLREHLNGVLSTVETTMTSSREKLVTAGVLEKPPGEIEAAAAQCNLAEVLWSYQDSSRATLDPVLKEIRRFVGRRNPEAMIREMAEGGRDSFSFWWSQPHVLLGNYGYDRNMVKREIRRARKLILKDEYAKEREQDLRAAQVWTGCRF